MPSQSLRGTSTIHIHPEEIVRDNAFIDSWTSWSSLSLNDYGNTISTNITDGISWIPPVLSVGNSIETYSVSTGITAMEHPNSYVCYAPPMYSNEHFNCDYTAISANYIKKNIKKNSKNKMDIE